SQRIADILQLRSIRSLATYIVRRDHKKIMIECFCTYQLILDCAKDAGQHRRQLAIGRLRPVHHGYKTFPRQRMKQILDLVPLPPDTSADNGERTHGCADKMTPRPHMCPSPQGEAVRGGWIESMQRAAKSAASSFWIVADALGYQLNTKRRDICRRKS